ncbi:MAG: PAS domain-containing protein, partial [Bacteroidetes bacterium]|nr:PAS domain-containing protein [Bacteroidota bacterium]
MTKTDPYFSSSEFDRWQHPTLPTLPETLLDRLAVITACSLGTDVAQINLVDEDHVITLASTSGACATTRRQDSPCGLAVEHGDVLCIEDLREDPRTAHLSAARTGTARFYAGTPIRTPDGQTLGTLAVLAPQPRSLSPDQRNVLVSMARLLERSLSHPNGRAPGAPAPSVRANEERLALALESADLGLWDWHIETGKVYLNDRWSTMIGYEPGEIAPTFDAWTSLLHPDDAAPVMNTLQRHLDGKTATYEAEYRLRTKDGSWRWIQDRGRVTERAPDGAPIRAIGI